MTYSEITTLEQLKGEYLLGNIDQYFTMKKLDELVFKHGLIRDTDFKDSAEYYHYLRKNKSTYAQRMEFKDECFDEVIYGEDLLPQDWDFSITKLCKGNSEITLSFYLYLDGDWRMSCSDDGLMTAQEHRNWKEGAFRSVTCGQFGIRPKNLT